MVSFVADLDVDDFVADERLEEDADEAHQPVLHVTVLDGLARRDAVGDVQVDEFGRQFHSRRQPVNDLHRVKRHLHVDQHTAIRPS